MRLPGEPRAEFVLMLPMTPSKRDNMIARLAARVMATTMGRSWVRVSQRQIDYGPAH
jgi:uncharacterized membrane protein (UPF0182 family)